MSRMALLLNALEEEMQEIEHVKKKTRQQYLYRELVDIDVIKHFRMTRNVFEGLCEELIPLLKPRNASAVDPRLKVLAALSFYAKGSYQGCVGNSLYAPMAQQSVSRCLEEVTLALNRPEIIRKYMRFPQNRNERDRIKRGFYNMFGIPGVIGAIDCTHVAIIKPTLHEERFFNRKHFHSLNVQVICDHQCIINNVDASYGGATHDSFIWAQSPIVRHLEQLHNSGEKPILLGDSGYPLRKYLMTPVDGANDDLATRHYNNVQKRARSIIERTFGLLKSRWRCLLAAREMHYRPEKAGFITIACCILHNICMRNGIGIEYFSHEEEQIEATLQPLTLRHEFVSSLSELEEGRRARENLILLLNRR